MTESETGIPIGCTCLCVAWRSMQHDRVWQMACPDDYCPPSSTPGNMAWSSVRACSLPNGHSDISESESSALSTCQPGWPAWRLWVPPAALQGLQQGPARTRPCPARAAASLLCSRNASTVGSACCCSSFLSTLPNLDREKLGHQKIAGCKALMDAPCHSRHGQCILLRLQQLL